MKEKKKGLILDRDGVVCKILPSYLLRLEEFELVPNIKEFVRAAKDKGYMVAIATNQPQVGKGLLAEDHLREIHAHMESALEGMIDKVYYCPHLDEDVCSCRKPKAGMLLQAAEDLDLDLSNSIMVGDGDKDVFTGQAVGCRTIFIRNEVKGQYLKNCTPDLVVDDLIEAISFL
jgi:histidinol-phosphate phosphatase family protein